MPSKEYLLVYVSSLPDDVAARFEVDRQVALAGAVGAGLVWDARYAQYDWELVKKQIAQADAFLLLLGENYGPTTPTGISFQHRELVYAQSLHKPVYYLMQTGMDGSGTSDVRLQELRQQVRSQVSGKIWHLLDELSVHVKTLLKNWERDVKALARIADDSDRIRMAERSFPTKVAPLGTPPRKDIELIAQANVYRGGNLAHQLVKLPMKTDRIWRSVLPLLRLGASEDRLRTHMEQVLTAEVKARLLSDNPGSHAVDGVRIERNQFRRVLDGWSSEGYVEHVKQGARTIWSLPS